MGSTSKVCSVILRVWELVCSAVVLGLTARFVNLVIRAGASNDARIIYTLTLASISTLYSILFMPPLMYTFLAFAADFILFVMWLVAFCLLVTVSLPLLLTLGVVLIETARRHSYVRCRLVLQLLGMVLGRWL